MKSLVPFTLITSVLLASCGGGGGSDQGRVQNDDGSPEAPVTPLPEVPITPPVTDQAPQLGALSDLIGVVGVAYAFTDTAPVFGLGLEFTADDLLLTDDGVEFLFGNAVTLTRLTPTAENIRGRDLFFGCSFSDAIGQFLCILDAEGDNQSFFTFDRLVDGSAQGSFEFCNGATTEACASGVLDSPDGYALIGVSSPQAASNIASKAASEKTDLLPYLQYLKQGSPEDDIVANSPSRYADALIADARNLKEALARD